jgi:hypothetical protein
MKKRKKMPGKSKWVTKVEVWRTFEAMVAVFGALVQHLDAALGRRHPETDQVGMDLQTALSKVSAHLYALCGDRPGYPPLTAEGRAKVEWTRKTRVVVLSDDEYDPPGYGSRVLDN